MVDQIGPSGGTYKERGIPDWIEASGFRWHFERTILAENSIDLGTLRDDETVIYPGLIYRRGEMTEKLVTKEEAETVTEQATKGLQPSQPAPSNRELRVPRSGLLHALKIWAHCLWRGHAPSFIRSHEKGRLRRCRYCQTCSIDYARRFPSDYGRYA